MSGIRSLRITLVILLCVVAILVIFPFVKGRTPQEDPLNTTGSGVIEDVEVQEEELDIGKPSEGITHIDQTVIPENPYSNTDEQAAINFAKTGEGKLIEELFDSLNNPEITKISADLTEDMSLGEVHQKTTISEDFEGILWGYRFQDERDRLLYDGNIIKNFQPHNDLLNYLKVLRPNRDTSVLRVGRVVPELGTGGSNLTTLKINGEEKEYLIQRMKGSLLLKQASKEGTKYYVASYNMAIASPRGEDIGGLQYYVWHQDLLVSLESVEDSEFERVKNRYFVE